MHKAWRDEIWISNIDIRRGWVTYVLSLRTNGKFIASPRTPFINMVYFCSYRKIVTIPGRTLDKNKVVRNYMKNKLFWITQLVACYYNFSSTPIPFSVYGDDFKMLWNITVTKVRKRMQSDNFRLHQSLFSVRWRFQKVVKHHRYKARKQMCILTIFIHTNPFFNVR